ncbi:hypothetical protein C0583_03590 [Candidatus Parcubacteria bacterium]|nr:MAG: hypothetical protein C0583_03590 [Candidatus Parcubacteria bacterium]
MNQVKNEKKQEATEKEIGKASLLMRKYLDKYFGFIILIGVFSVLIISYFFLLWPKYIEITTDINKYKTEIETEEKAIKKYEDRLVKYRNEYEAIDELNKDRVNEMVGESQKFPSIYQSDLYISLTDYILTEGFSLIDINIEPVVQNVQQTTQKRVVTKNNTEETDKLPAGVTEVSINIELEELNYDDFKRLLVLLEKKLRLVDVVEVDYTTSKESVKLFLKTYYFTNSIL